MEGHYMKKIITALFTMAIMILTFGFISDHYSNTYAQEGVRGKKAPGARGKKAPGKISKKRTTKVSKKRSPRSKKRAAKR